MCAHVLNGCVHGNVPVLVEEQVRGTFIHDHFIFYSNTAFIHSSHHKQKPDFSCSPCPFPNNGSRCIR
jgi:hypothetical protein